MIMHYNRGRTFCTKDLNMDTRGLLHVKRLLMLFLLTGSCSIICFADSATENLFVTTTFSTEYDSDDQKPETFPDSSPDVSRSKDQSNKADVIQKEDTDTNPEDISCPVDLGLFTDCLENARHAIADYLKALHKERPFDICRRYEELGDCSRTGLFKRFVRHHHLHPLRQFNEDWVVITRHLHKLCVARTTEAIESQLCFEREICQPLSLRCDEYYSFNVKQGTKSACFFKSDLLKCKEALVSSACGRHDGSFAFHALRLSESKQLEKLACNISRSDRHNVFRYTEDQCSPRLVEETRTCTTRHLRTKQVGEFHKQNDLVALGNNFTQYCRAYQRYRNCLQPMVTSCPRGVSLFLEYEESLRRYMLKMDNICSKNIHDVYVTSMPCYERAVNRGALERCVVHWTELMPSLNNITAVEFYCHLHSPNTVKLRLDISRSVSCHAEVFEEDCGPNASAVMADLIRKALDDPLYLRLGYRPDCKLHAGHDQQERISATASIVDTSEKAREKDDDDSDDNNDDGNNYEDRRDTSDFVDTNPDRPSATDTDSPRHHRRKKNNDKHDGINRRRNNRTTMTSHHSVTSRINVDSRGVYSGQDLLNVLASRDGDDEYVSFNDGVTLRHSSIVNHLITHTAFLFLIIRHFHRAICLADWYK